MVCGIEVRPKSWQGQVRFVDMLCVVELYVDMDWKWLSRPHTKGLHIHLDSTKQKDVLRKLSVVENILKQLETLKGNDY